MIAFSPARKRRIRIAAAGLTLLAMASMQPLLAQTSASSQPTPVQGPAPYGPIALVPLDSNSPESSAKVTGALEVFAGKAVIGVSGTVTSGARTTAVVLPHRGVLRVCASTTVKLASDGNVAAGETPGLMMALDQGAVEASFATGQNSDVLLTPDFRILIGGPGAAEVKVRLGPHGDTCVDNAGVNAPYVLVSSVFEGGAYRVQAGQRVMFQHGSLQEVVDQEKEPCGCPPEPRPGSNDFPLAESAGLAPLKPAAPVAKPTAADQGVPDHAPAVAGSAEHGSAQINEPLVYTAPTPASDQPAHAAQPPAAPVASAAPAAGKSAPQKRGFFRRVGGFFRRIFGAE